MAVAPEASYVIFLLQPCHRNFSKRLIKSPKLYFYDTGVVSSLLKLTAPEMAGTHYLYGALFENLVIAEILKCQVHKGRPSSVYYWRESNGAEIDCIIENGPGQITALEIKSGQSFTADFLKNLKNFPYKDSSVRTEKILLYNGDTISQIGDIRLTNWKELPALIEQLI